MNRTLSAIVILGFLVAATSDRTPVDASPEPVASVAVEWSDVAEIESTPEIETPSVEQPTVYTVSTAADCNGGSCSVQASRRPVVRVFSRVRSSGWYPGKNLRRLFGRRRW